MDIMSPIDLLLNFISFDGDVFRRDFDLRVALPSQANWIHTVFE
jgi:hypothetical protein